nr:alpha/beta fold hydrolase [Hyphomonas sp. Mor2]
MQRLILTVLMTFAISGCAAGTDSMTRPQAASTELTAIAADGATVFGTASFTDLPDSAPLIVLFHQGGSNARAEYAPLIPWLNSNGFRAVAWDLRVGGELYGLNNRTADARLPVKPSSYCEGFPDMHAALETSLEYGAANTAIIWGSSYSGALVFHLAADAPDKVSHVISASPANGPPMVDCLPQARLDELQTPAFVLSPRIEMKSPEDFDDKARFEAAGVTFIIVEDGIHGSSMLVDERTEADMSLARATVMDWLKSDPS